MERILQLLNEMEKEGFIARYALGGGIAVLFYAETVLTEDIDILVLLPQQPSSVVVLTPLYEFLERHGGTPKGEYVDVDGWLLQLLVPADPLEVEAVKEAVEVTYHGVKVRVLRPEHLVAIKLRLGRPKDIAHLQALLEHAKMDDGYLQDILKRYGLTERWHQFLSGR